MKASAWMLILYSALLMVAGNGYAANASAADGGETMNTYVIFFGFTAEGIQNIKASPERVRDAKATVEAMGGEMKAFYGILGSEFDTMFILDAPGDEAVSKMVLTIAKGGNVRTRTHRLFTEQQYGKLISELP